MKSNFVLLISSIQFLRFHRAFFEASKEHYSELFQESNERDKLLMNIIDYYTEKWNYEAKPYDHNEKITKKLIERNGFDYVKNEKRVVKRYTRSQKIEYLTKIGNNQYKVSYNLRKLNDLPYYIELLHDKLKVINLLTEYCLLNYEFMHAKACIKKMNFVFELNNELLNQFYESIDDRNMKVKLGNLLYFINFYKENYMMLNMKPNALAQQILFRLNRKIPELKEFVVKSIKHCGISALHSFMSKNLKILDLLYVDSSLNVFNLIWSSDLKTSNINEKLLFVPLKSNKLDDSEQMVCKNSELYVVNYESNKELGFLDLIGDAKFIFISIFSINSNDNLNSINGHVIYLSENKIFLKKFDNTRAELVYEIDPKNGQVVELLQLSHQYILIRFMKSFQIINIKSKKVLFNEQFGSDSESIECKFMISNLPKQQVYISEYDKLSKFIVFGLLNSEIWVYRFDGAILALEIFLKFELNANFELNSSDELERYRIEDFCIYDQSRLINNLAKSCQNDEIIRDEIACRFAIVDNNLFDQSFIRVVNVNVDATYNVIVIDNQTLNIENASNDKLIYSLNGFYDNKIIVEDSYPWSFNFDYFMHCLDLGS